MEIFPVVHGTRALALKAKISKTNTFERIARLSQMGLIEQQLSQDVSRGIGLSDEHTPKKWTFGTQAQPRACPKPY